MRTTGKRLLSILLCLCMAACMLPTVALAADPATPKAIMLGTSALKGNVNTASAPTVYFGENHEDTPKPGAWRVIGYEAETNSVASASGNMTLLADYNMGQTAFDRSSPYSHNYADSDLKTKIDALAGKLTTGETAAVASRTLTSGSYNEEKTDCIAGAQVDNAVFWPLSTAEAYAVNNDLRIVDKEHQNWASSYWWLRSPGINYIYAAVVDGSGDVNNYGYDVDYEYGVRPAFNLNLNFVLFTSAAVGGKIPAAGSGGNQGGEAADAIFEIPASTTSEWKLTLLDQSRNFAVTADTAAGKPGDTIQLAYSGATVGTNEYISAIIEDSSGALYYGRLKSITADTEAGGTVELKIPSDLAAGSYTLNLFSEQYNGGEKDDTKLTDYASAFDTVTLTVDTTPPTLTAGEVSRTSETEAAVKFTSDEAGSYYYGVVDSGAAEPTINTATAGTDCVSGENTISLTTLTAGARDIYIVVKDAAGNVSSPALKMTIPAYIVPVYSISAVPATLDFGSVQTGYTTPAVQTITVANTGNQQIALTQPTATNYTIGTLSKTTLAANETATFTVQPKEGLTVGNYDETLSISGSNNVSAQVQLLFSVNKAGSSGGYNPPVYYTLTFETNGGDKISPVSGSYNALIDLSKYAPKRSGYAFTGWYSDKGLTNKITSIRLNGSKTVYAGWQAEQNPNTGANPFTDVNTTDWFYNDVMFVYEKGLMLGTSKTTFSPYGTATRGMMATILWRMEGSPAPKGGNGFSDVDAGKWYADAITWTSENGIFAGYGKDKFGPDDPITREQLAAIFYRYADYKGYGTSVKGNLSKFKDADKISDYAETAMQWAVGSGLIKGRDDGSLDPQGTATRAEIAAMLHRFIKKYDLVQGTTSGGMTGWIRRNRLQIPQTGDSSALGLWGFTLCASLAAFLALTTAQLRRKREEEALQIIEK